MIHAVVVSGSPVTRYALIPTHNRPVELAACLTSLTWQIHHIVIIDNASDPPVADYGLVVDPGATVTILRDDEQPPNLSRLFNIGLDHIAGLAAAAGLPEWDVAVLNDDAVLPAGWAAAVGAAMRAGPAVAACSDPSGTLTVPILKTAPDRDLHTRMCPWAFLLRGEAGQRADETLRWWYQDTDLDWRARRRGGVAIIPGFRTVNQCANASTVGVLAEQAGRDRIRFGEIWGAAPW